MKNCYPIQSGNHLFFRAFLVIGVLFITLFMLSAGISAYEINGTATGNILNQGDAAKADGFSVHADAENDYALTVEKDNEITVADPDNAQSINICGEKVYYIHVNGDEYQTELRCYDMAAGKVSTVCSVPLDQGMKNLLVVDGKAMLISNGKVIAVDLAAETTETVFGGDIRQFVPVTGGYVYTVDGDATLYFRGDNGEISTLAQDVESFDCAEDAVYYSDVNAMVYSVALNGGEKTKVAAEGANLVYTDDLYMQRDEKVVSLNGGEEAVVTDSETASYSVLNDEVEVTEEAVATLAEVDAAASAVVLSGLPDGPSSDNYKEWKQWDSRWKDYPMGNTTIGSAGCAATAVSILLVGSGAEKDRYLKGTFRPDIFVKEMTANGGFTSGGGIYWGTVTKVNQNFKLYSDTQSSGSGFSGLSNVAKATAVSNHLAAGRFIILRVQNHRTGNTHFVAVDEVKNSEVYVCDPGYASLSGNLFDDYGTADRAIIYSYTGERWDGSNNGEDIPDPEPEWKNPFTDVKETAWYYDEVGEVYESGLMLGRSATEFVPEGRMTRAEFVCVIGRLIEADFDEYLGQAEFSDIDFQSKEHEWFSKYVGWAAANGLMVGDGNRFRPNDYITREEICSILIRLADYLNVTLENSESKVTFADSGKISSWAKADVEKAQLTGLVYGSLSGNRYYVNPKNNALRAEVAAMVLRFVGKMPIL